MVRVLEHVKKKVEKHKVYPMTRLATSLYQQILKVLFVSDFNGIGIFIRNVYIVCFLVNDNSGF